MKKVDVPGLKYPNQVIDLHELYIEALTEEFNSNNRPDGFLDELFEVYLFIFKYNFRNFKYKLHSSFKLLMKHSLSEYYMNYKLIYI